MSLFLSFSQISDLYLKDIDIKPLSSQKKSTVLFTMPKLKSLKLQNVKFESQLLVDMSEDAESVQVGQQ